VTWRVQLWAAARVVRQVEEAMPNPAAVALASRVMERPVREVEVPWLVTLTVMGVAVWLTEVVGN